MLKSLPPCLEQFAQPRGDSRTAFGVVDVHLGDGLARRATKLAGSSLLNVQKVERCPDVEFGDVAQGKLVQPPSAALRPEQQDDQYDERSAPDVVRAENTVRRAPKSP